MNKLPLAFVIGLVLTAVSFLYSIGPVGAASNPPFLLGPSLTIFSYNESLESVAPGSEGGALYSSYRGFPFIAYEKVHSGDVERHIVVQSLGLLMDVALYSLIAFATLSLIEKRRNGSKS